MDPIEPASEVLVTRVAVRSYSGRSLLSHSQGLNPSLRKTFSINIEKAPLDLRFSL